MKHKIKMVGIDLDGTLLTTEKKITPYTKSVLKKALAQGVIVLVSTGRPLTAIPKEALDISGMKYAVTTNGARVMDIEKNETIYESTLKVEEALQLLEVMCEYDPILEIFIDGVSYSKKVTQEKAQEYLKDPHVIEYFMTTRIHVEDLKEMLRDNPATVEKVHGIFRNHEEAQAVYDGLKKIPNVVVVSSFGNNWEINKEGTDKGKALLRLGESLGIKREEIMACGDSMNDYEMIKAVGLGVAMANADEEIKMIADYITESNDEDGVAKAIERFALE